MFVSYYKRFGKIKCYIHLTAEYKFSILSLKSNTELNVNLQLLEKIITKKFKTFYDLFSQHVVRLSKIAQRKDKSPTLTSREQISAYQLLHIACQLFFTFFHSKAIGGPNNSEEVYARNNTRELRQSIGQRVPTPISYHTRRKLGLFSSQLAAAHSLQPSSSFQQ